MSRHPTPIPTLASHAPAGLRALRLPAPRVRAVVAILLAAAACASPGAALLRAQSPSDDARGGPYGRLIVRNAMVIPGHGGSAYGPADIIIEGGTIAQIISYSGVTGRPADR